jgi:putative acetyltransferase
MNSSEIQIAAYQPVHKQRYIEINEAWIKKDYKMEEPDIKELHYPEEFILKNGGAIIVALMGGEVIGTCALMYRGAGIYEMVKMAVDETCRGLGVGNMLCAGIIAKAKELHAAKIILYSNTVHSGKAVMLYRKFGFYEVQLGETEWLRADIKMEMNL